MEDTTTYMAVSTSLCLMACITTVWRITTVWHMENGGRLALEKVMDIICYIDAREEEKLRVVIPAALFPKQ